MAWPSSIPTFVPGPALVADLNDLGDALKAIGDQWTAYTPTLTAATTDPTLGTSSITGRYRKLGKTADIHIRLVIGASGWDPGSGIYRFGLPSGVVPYLQNAGGAMGVATVRDASVPVTYAYRVTYFATTAVQLISTGTSPASLTSSAPITWANGDAIDLHIQSLEIQ